MERSILFFPLIKKEKRSNTIMIESELNIALENVEKARNKIIEELDKETNEKRIYTLIDYKLELLDVKLRLKDMLKNLRMIK